MSMKSTLWNLINKWRDATTTEAAWLARDLIDVELDQVEALTAERNEARQKFNEADLMAECTTMLRNDLIEAGIVSETVPPMMLTEAIMVRVKQLGAECAAAVEAGHAAVEMCGELINERDSLRAEIDQIKAGAQPAEIEALRADAERSEPCPECFSHDCNGECSGDGAMGD